MNMVHFIKLDNLFQFHQRYNPNLIDDDDQEIESLLKKRHAKDSTRTPTSKSSPFAAPNLAPMLIINETPQVQAHDGDHVGLWQGERWSVTPQQRPHTSTGVEFEDGGLWQVRVRV